MANQKISALTAASALNGTELVPVVQGGENRRATVAEIRAAREIIQFACSDLTTALEAAESVGYCRAPRAFTLTAVRASLLEASSSGAVTIDINVNGESILSTKLTIDGGAKTSVGAQAPAVISDAEIDDDDEITVDIDGAGTDAKGLVITLLGAPS